MIIKIMVDETTIKQLIVNHINQELGDARVHVSDVSLLVKSKNNYRSKEWEEAYLCVTTDPQEFTKTAERVVPIDAATEIAARVTK